MWTTMDGKERVKRWRKFRHRQIEESESSFDDEYEESSTSPQDSDRYMSFGRKKPLLYGQEQWQLFNPVDTTNNPSVAYYEPDSAMRPRTSEKCTKRSSKPTKKSPRSVADDSLMVEI
jgi:hypothetical protein